MASAGELEGAALGLRTPALLQFVPCGRREWGRPSAGATLWSKRGASIVRVKNTFIEALQFAPSR